VNSALFLLHTKAAYVILIEKHDNGCIVKYPPNYLIEPSVPANTEKYSFIDNQLILESSLNGEKEVEIYGYDNRIIVMTDIILKANKLKISKQLIRYFDGLKEKRGLFSVLPEPKGEFLEKENKLKDNYSNIYSKLYFPADAEKEGILEGFNNIQNLIVKGEL
jgi:hypothetical protein